MEKSKRVILFDIDYTLFNTASYKKKLYPFLAEELGIKDQDNFAKITSEASEYTKKEIGHFDPETFLSYLLQFAKNPSTLEKLESIYWSREHYGVSLYQEVIPVLEELQKNNSVIIGILSTGDTKHQETKIHSLNTYFKKEHLHIFANKVTELKSVLERYKQDTVYLIDDLPVVLSEAKLIRKDIFTVWIKRSHIVDTQEESTFKPDYIISDISELLQIIV